MKSQLPSHDANCAFKRAVRTAVIVSTCLSSIAFGQINQAINQSVWKQKYGVLDAQMAQQAPYTNWLSEDADGDGVKNNDEFLAGTNPFKKLPNSPHFRPPNLDLEPTTLSLTFPTVVGKSYGLEANNGLVGPWVKGSLPTVMGDGTVKTLTVPQSAGRFFRVTVTDQSTPNDQVSDWAKAALGLSTTLPISSQSSFSASSLAASLDTQNIVSLDAMDASAVQPIDVATPAGDRGVIRITRSGYMLVSSITVPLIRSGSGVEGTDYHPLPTSVTFPEGVNSLDITITPKFNANRSTSATVFLAVNTPTSSGAAGSYTTGTPALAGVTIYPAGAPNGTGLTAEYYIGGSTTYANIENFGGLAASYTYTRNSGSTTNGVAVITYTGTPSAPFIVGGQAALQFRSGNLNIAPFNATGNIYTLTAVSAPAATPQTFTVNITGTGLPANSSGNVSIGSFRNAITRLDSTVNFNWGFGTPNGNTFINPDNYSVSWEGYLSPTATGDHTFRLDADDKARVLLDTGAGLVQILENGWDTPATGGFKESAAIPLSLPAAPGNRYRVRVEFVETTGSAKCVFQIKRSGGNFQYIPNTSVASIFTDNSGATTGWNANFYNNTTLSGAPARTQTDSSITNGNNGDWGIGTPDSSIPANNFSARWTGQVMPQYSQTYYFVVNADDGSRLWVNNQLLIDKWSGVANQDQTSSIELQAGVKYDIKLEYNEISGSARAQLSWYSNDQAKQIIPTERLFPTITGSAPLAGNPPAGLPAITSPTSAVAILGSGSPFSLNLTASNGGTFSASGLPAWLTLSGNVLSGTPPAAGIYQFTVTTANALGSGSAVMALEVLAAGNALTRDLWTSGVTGSGIINVPWTSAPTTSDTVPFAENATTTYGTNTGERLRGYFIAPTTGNYYFWIAASNVAELWISNDSEPVTKIRRAYVTAPGTAAKTWDAQPNQRSPWLSLVAGERYYIEALHNTGTSGVSNHLSIGWFLDPTGNSAPIANGSVTAAASVGGIMPSFVLSPWDNPPTTTIPGTIYVSNLQGAAGLSNITGSGGAFLRVNGSSAVVKLNFTGLTSGAISRKIYNSTTNQVIFDIDAQDRNYPALKTSDGGYTWNIQPTDLTALNSGNVSLRVSTTNNPAGEIAGTFSRVAGSQTQPAMPSYPAWTDDHATNDAANSRFLTQATFGPNLSDLAAVKSMGYRAWIDDQFTKTGVPHVTNLYESIIGNPGIPYQLSTVLRSWWKNSITGQDQLRQRVAFALSEICVVSDNGPLNDNGLLLSHYYDTLHNHSFANFRDILKEVTLSPTMGRYLDMMGNRKGNIVTGQIPNENYAREILQLFSAGLYRVWPNGTLVLDSTGSAVPTYDQNTVIGFSRVFTGWHWGQELLAGGRLPTNFNPSSRNFDQMMLVPTQHELGTKRLLDRVVLPAALITSSSDTSTGPAYTIPVPTTAVGGQPSAPIITSITNQYDANGLRDLENALDNIINNPAVAPYICRQLIQRLVTSHPKPEYVHRVVRAFNGERNVDGIATGVKGDMKEVIRAILLDYEARSPVAAGDPQFGKQREPVLRLTATARAFPSVGIPNSTYRGIGSRQLLINTPTPHRLINNDGIWLDNFVDSSASSKKPTPKRYAATNTTPSYSLAGATGIATITALGYQVGDLVSIRFTSGALGTTAPYNVVQSYTVTSATTTNFTINIGSTTAFTGTITGNTETPNHFVVDRGSIASPNYTSIGSTVSIGTNGYAVGEKVYLKFSLGGLATGAFDGVYTVASTVASPASFSVTLPSSPANTTGIVSIPRITGGYNVTNITGGSNIDFYGSENHDLQVGDAVRIDFLISNSGVPAVDGEYTVTSIISPMIFRVTTSATLGRGSQSGNGCVIYPLVGPNLNRSGTLTVGFNTWDVGQSDNILNQTPLDAPSVFNFFYPDYQYPGAIAQAGMTTPEFQLTNDSNTMNLTNSIADSYGTGNTNGYSGYRSNAVTMDLSPYMTPALTSNAGISGLVDQMNILLVGGNLTPAAKTAIVNYVANTTNFPLTSPTPSNTQMRNRVRAIVQLIVTSAEFAIQR
ncbi:MAG: DUF1800 family protein [Akkermansiaceae bacterium]|nr:DUF1800 family protein [Akkermansiaceae bacterium]